MYNMEFTEEERQAMIEEARIGNKKYKQQLANYIWASKNRPKINAYYRRRYAECADVREKSRIKQNRFRYNQGKYVNDKLVDEIRAQYNLSVEEMPYCVRH